MKKRIIHILFHPLILSLPFAVTIILLLPPIFDRYRAVLLMKQNVGTRKVIYHDFDHDSISEEIYLATEQPEGNIFSTVLIHKNGKVFEQPRLPGNFRPDRPYMFGDYNGNGMDEIYIFTYRNDSIFINGLEPISRNKFFITINQKVKYVCNYILDKDGNIDFAMDSVGVFDLNRDGMKEIVFSIYTAWSGQPRNIFAFDRANDTIISSPISGTALYEPIKFDLNNDTFYEIMGNTNAYGNRKELAYADTCTWLMVLDHQLNFLFPPRCIGEHHSWLQVAPFRDKNNIYIAALDIEKSTDAPESSLSLFDINDNPLHHRILENKFEEDYSYLFTLDKFNRNKLCLVYEDGTVKQFNSDLDIINKKKIKIGRIGLSLAPPYMTDIDNDGDEEFLFPTIDFQNIVLTRNDFSYPVVINIGLSEIRSFDFSVKLAKQERPLLFIQHDEQTYLYSYFKNPLFFLQYFIYIGIYLFIAIIIFVSQKTQQIRIKRKYDLPNEIAQLQMKFIQTQIDPHFTLNLINSIGNLFEKRDTEKANLVFGKYTKLLRNSLLNSDNTAIPLSEEIDYVSNYLELEKFRMDDKFEYNIRIDENIDTQTIIPKMLVHTFAENAIIHGIKHLKGNGILNISIKSEDKNLLICIADNGIGRAKEKEYSQFSAGRGLHILDQILQIYFQLYNVKITYEVNDLYDNSNQPSGTKVEITIPEGGGKMKDER
ncbi:MAG: histidine kinase [Bacteroidetes bacterium]|nr:histidine kinase [Bacteroidota bacterium]